MAEEFSLSATIVAVNEAAARINNNKNRIEQASNGLGVVVADLDGMAGTFGGVISRLGVEASNNPEDTVLASLNAQFGSLVAEYGALKTSATNKKTALDKA